MIDDRRLRRLARIACGVTVALALGSAAFVLWGRIGTSYHPRGSAFAGIPDALIGLTYAVVGVIVTLKRPANLVGWALLLAGAGSQVGHLAAAYGRVAVLAHPGAGLPGGTTVAAVSPGSWTPLMAGVFVLLVTFPSGAAATRRTRRWLISVLAGFGLVWAAITLSHGRLDPPLHQYENPIAILPEPMWLLIIGVIAFCLLSIFVAGVDAVRRFRRSRGLERQQFKWLAASAGFVAATLPFATAFNWERVSGAIFGLALMALPISVGVAVLRYRLYEIDRIVSRTLSYALLTGFLVAVFVGLVLLTTRVLPFSSPVGVAASTLAAAGLFTPLRSRLQRLVDRRFNRAHYDAEATVTAFGARLRDAVDPETVLTELATAAGGSLQPSHVSVWVRGPQL